MNIRNNDYEYLKYIINTAIEQNDIKLPFDNAASKEYLKGVTEIIKKDLEDYAEEYKREVQRIINALPEYKQTTDLIMNVAANEGRRDITNLFIKGEYPYVKVQYNPLTKIFTFYNNSDLRLPLNCEPLFDNKNRSTDKIMLPVETMEGIRLGYLKAYFKDIGGK